MKEVVGGVSWEMVAAIGGLIVFFLGFLNGYTNPESCHNQKGVILQELNNTEMQNIYGGSLPSGLLNAIAKIIDSIYNLGEGTGSGIRRLIEGKYCPVN